jgi:hypothetical protein
MYRHSSAVNNGCKDNTEKKKIPIFRHRFYLHLMLNKTRVFVITTHPLNIDVTEQVNKF